MTREMAMVHAREGIRINALSPYVPAWTLRMPVTDDPATIEVPFALVSLHFSEMRCQTNITSASPFDGVSKHP